MKEKTIGSRVFRWKPANIFDYLVRRRKMLLQLLENTCKPRHCEISVVTSLDPLIYFSKSVCVSSRRIVRIKLSCTIISMIDRHVDMFSLFKLFEGMKAYRGVDGKIRIFRPDMNMERMNSSAIRSGLPTFSGPELIKCIQRIISIDQEWVPHSEASSLYIRPTLIGIDPTLGVAAADSALLYVILSPVGSYFKNASTEKGVSLLADPRYTRAWPGGCGDAKMGSNYAPTIQVQREATEKGLQQVLWLYGDDNQLTEVGTMNIFMVYLNDDGEKELVTPPLNGLILPGITRNSILALSREWNQFRVSERTITMGEVRRLLSQKRLLELFGAGTACIVSPVSHIDFVGEDLQVPSMEQENALWRTFLKHLTDIQYGYVRDHPWALEID